MMICTACHKTFTGKYAPEGAYCCPECWKNLERERGLAYMQWTPNWKLRLPDCKPDDLYIQETLRRVWRANGFGKQVRETP